MPSLADSLVNLALQSEQITHLASLNARPAGPYTQAYLHLPQALSAQMGVTGLIRDASEAEVRLFKFIGETDPSTGSATAAGGEKRIEKRDGVMVTPLREVQRRKEEGTASVDFVLQKALRLVDDYRPMPRARAHIANLLHDHAQQVERIAELEKQISEATNPSKPVAQTVSPTTATTSTSPAKKALTPDEAIKAEEESIKALEQSLLPLRRAASAKPASASSVASPAKSPAQVKSPARPQTGAALAAQTPAKTPLPNITNSLVNGTTPHRSVAAHHGPLNRFSPLRLLGTPKAGAGPSSLRQEANRSIFGKRLNRSTNRSTPAPLDLKQSQQRDSEVPVSTAGDDADAGSGDETIRIKRAPVELAEPVSPAAKRTPTKAATPKSVVSPSGSTPTKMRSPMRRKVEGVDVSLESVRVSVAKIWETLGDLMRTGTKEPPSTSVEDTVKHLHHLSMSDPAPPPSPSSASSSTLNSAPGVPLAAKAIPVKSQDILVAHLCLLLLRAASPGNSDGGVAMADVKERLETIAKARGWDGAAEQGTKVVYTAVAKRTVRIDRRGGAGGRVKFAD